jgi:hypothetical protein
MKRNIGYWGATGLVAIVALLGGFSYVTNAPEAVESFRRVGYPQQLRVLLGIDHQGASQEQSTRGSSDGSASTSQVHKK